MSFDSNKPLAINPSTGLPAVIGGGSTLTFDNNVTFSSGTTVTFTGATTVGLTASVVSVSDGTGTAGFLGSAGAWSTTGLTSVSWSVGGSGTLSLLSDTGSATLGDDTGTLVFDGSGNLSTNGVQDLTWTGGGNVVVGSVGGGSVTLEDDVSNIVLDGSGAWSTTGIVSLSVGASSSISITGSGTATAAFRSGSGNATFGDGTGSFVFAGSGGLSTNAVTSIDLDGSGAIQINSSAGKIQIGNDAVSQDLDLGTGGTRNINIGGGNAATIIFAKSTVLLSEGTNAAPKVFATLKTANATIAVGDVLCYDTGANAGKVILADANGGTANLRAPVGTCILASSAGNPTGMATGIEVPVTFASAPASSAVGGYVYLSETAGRGTLTAPSTSGTNVVILGILASANGSDTTCLVAWAPQFLYVA